MFIYIVGFKMMRNSCFSLLKVSLLLAKMCPFSW